MDDRKKINTLKNKLKYYLDMQYYISYIAVALHMAFFCSKGNRLLRLKTFPIPRDGTHYNTTWCTCGFNKPEFIEDEN